jgi:L-amino acid N-acyltransferase YncA
MMVREARDEDAAACAAIYAPYVTDTAITFELTPPSESDMAARITAARGTHAWLVATDEDAGQVIGYAYGGPYKERAAYRWSCEVSVYVARDSRGKGAGRRLYEALLPALAARGYHMAVAGMTLPNPGSEALHQKLGFTPIGTYRSIGWKHNNWHDVKWTQRPLTPASPPFDRGESPFHPC